MDVRKRLIKIAQRRKVIRKLWLKKENKLKIGSSVLIAENIHFRNNAVFLEGPGQNVLVDSEGYCRDTRIVMRGEENKLHISGSSVLSENTSVAVRGKRNRIVIEPGCSIRNCSIFIAGNDNNVIFRGENSAFGLDIHIEEDGNLADIGRATSFHGRDGQHIELALDEASAIRLGADCMLSSGIRMRSSDSHSIVDMAGSRLNHAEDIIIGDHCWIGLNAILLKGTCIPAHCIVGAGAVAARSFEREHCVIAGNPATVVREGVDWDRKLV